MAEVLKGAGYATALLGKWHLGKEDKSVPIGFDPATMPNAQGFDYFYGTPLFNGYNVFMADGPFRSPILRNGEVVVKAVENWDNITADYTREAIASFPARVVAWRFTASKPGAVSGTLVFAGAHPDLETVRYDPNTIAIDGKLDNEWHMKRERCLRSARIS
jgi:arylsulfatase A-like enzyme